MNVPVLQLTPYSWRGKSYKDIRNLMKAVDRVHPSTSITFGPDTMHVRDRRTNTVTKYFVERGAVNAIAAEPTPEVAQ